MTDIGISLSWWDVIFIFATEFWWVGGLVTVLLLLGGWLWRGVPRLVLCGAAALVLGLTVYMPAAMLIQIWQAARYDALMVRMHVLKPRVIDGVMFPVGSAVNWTDRTFTDAFDINPARPLENSWRDDGREGAIQRLRFLVRELG